jgi:Protein of unknown function (DUF3500)
MRNSVALSLLVALAAAFAGPAAAAQSVGKVCGEARETGGDAASVAAAIAKLKPLLKAPQLKTLERPLNRESAIQWSNLPLGVVPRAGLRLGDLNDAQSAAARRVFEAALSACGLRLLDEVRLADDYLIPFDRRPIGWDGRNYFLSVLGDPAASSPWMLQLGGHHLAFNFTFNGRQPGATPLFLGSEPIRFEMKGTTHEPLTVQSTAMSSLAAAIATHPEARLSGTFTDVVKGVEVTQVPGNLPTGGIDSGFPHAFPSGETDRGIRVSALNEGQRQRVREAIDSYVSLPGAAVSAALRAVYENPQAFEATYVGFAGSPDLGTEGSYVRIDGPRLWMEFVVQRAVAKPETLHYHALWRDKQSDYGGEIGP